MAFDPFNIKMSKEEMEAGSGSRGPAQQWKPTSNIVFKFHQCVAPEKDGDYFVTDDGTHLFGVTISLECIRDDEGVNTTGSLHENRYWLTAFEQPGGDYQVEFPHDAEEAGTEPSRAHQQNATRFGMMSNLTFKMFGGRNPRNPGNYPFDNDDEPYAPWVALKKYGNLAEFPLQAAVVKNGDFINLKNIRPYEE